MLDLPLDTSGTLVGWIACWNGKKVEVDTSEASSLWSAQQVAIKKLKPPKSQHHMVTTMPAYKGD
tara:strand:- start:1614 stop:1808 length:195 start_codon:yes stop_codon:yes gene_type:complete